MSNTIKNSTKNINSGTRKSDTTKKSKVVRNNNNGKSDRGSGLYAAYGSNLSVSQMSYRCPDSEIVGTGKIMDYKLVFRLHADIEKHEGDFVPVLIWRISKADEKRLDRYEGVKGGYYHQENVSVVMDDETDSTNGNKEINAGEKGKELVAMAYIMNTQDTISAPDAGYYQIIDEGYEHFGFDKKILKEALIESMDVRMDRN